MSILPTPRECIRRECLNCLGATKTAQAHDCLSNLCPLYPAHPFRGRLIPAPQRPRDYDEAAEQARIAAHHKKHPRRQPSKRIINLMCRQCQEGRDDCGATHCGLYPWRPWQPGGQPKRELSETQRQARSEAMRRLNENRVPDDGNGRDSAPGASGPTDGPPGLFSGENSAKSGPLVEAKTT